MLINLIIHTIITIPMIPSNRGRVTLSMPLPYIVCITQITTRGCCPDKWHALYMKRVMCFLAFFMKKENLSFLFRSRGVIGFNDFFLGKDIRHIFLLIFVPLTQIFMKFSKHHGGPSARHGVLQGVLLPEFLGHVLHLAFRGVLQKMGLGGIEYPLNPLCAHL